MMHLPHWKHLRFSYVYAVDIQVVEGKDLFVVEMKRSKI